MCKAKTKLTLHQNCVSHFNISMSTFKELYNQETNFFFLSGLLKRIIIIQAAETTLLLLDLKILSA
jgi:hypothetical protein